MHRWGLDTCLLPQCFALWGFPLEDMLAEPRSDEGKMSAAGGTSSRGKAGLEKWFVPAVALWSKSHCTKANIYGSYTMQYMSAVWCTLSHGIVYLEKMSSFTMKVDCSIKIKSGISNSNYITCKHIKWWTSYLAFMFAGISALQLVCSFTVNVPMLPTNQVKGGFMIASNLLFKHVQQILFIPQKEFFYL